MRAACAGLIALLAMMAGSTALADDTPPAGATSCTGCHGPQMLSLNDLTADDIQRAMAEFRSGARTATLMNRIAAGFTDEQSAAIAAWLEQR